MANPMPSIITTLVRRRGSVLLSTMFFIILLVVAVGAIFDLVVTNYKIAKRNEIRAQARAVAESELEYLFYRIKDDVISNGGGISAVSTPDRLYLAGIADNATNGTNPSTPRTPFSASHQADNNGDGWIVYRSVSIESLPDASITWPVTGFLPGSTTKVGRFVFLVAKVEVCPPASNPLYGKLAVCIGRHAYSSTSSIFQYNVFAQGDLEFAPGGNTVIEGDIAANGNIYMASQGAGSSLTIKAQVRFMNGGTFNAYTDTTTTPPTVTSDIYRKIGTYNTATGGNTTLSNANTNLNAPIGVTGSVLGGGSAQLETMSAAENLLGGLDAAATAAQYGINDSSYSLTGSNTNAAYTGLFGNITADPNLATATFASQLAAAQNQVNRSLLAPPPSAVYSAAAAASSAQQAAVISAEYPAYSTLAQIQAAADDASISALRAYTKAGLVITVGASGSTVTVTGTDSATGAAMDLTSSISPALTTIATTAATPMYDLREGRKIAVTQIDVGALTTALNSLASAPSGTPFNFNGLLYVYLANSSSATPAAVRLVNGATTPGYTNSTGFSVATNGGLYVKGDYNTISSNGVSVAAASGVGVVNPAMLMGDAVTVLSSNWSDANSSAAITSRVATGGTTTVAAGILTGATPATATTASGGAQNLVRFLEDWYTPSSAVKFYGAIGRLFNSTQFTRPFVTGTGVYQQPALRTFSFNKTLKSQVTPGAPEIADFSRGSFFVWQP